MMMMMMMMMSFAEKKFWVHLLKTEVVILECLEIRTCHVIDRYNRM
jgi:hypothetical protein